MKINPGSGYDYRKDFVNVDCNPIKKDVHHDLNIFPYPFKNDSAEFILASAVLEHLPIPAQIKLLNECWRILKVGGVLKIIVPHYTSFQTYQDIEHIRGYSYHTFDTFVKGKQPHSMGDYAGRHKFSSIKTKLVFAKGFQKWNYFVEWLANALPDFYEQTFLSAWPAEGVHVELTK